MDDQFSTNGDFDTEESAGLSVFDQNPKSVLDAVLHSQAIIVFNPDGTIVEANDIFLTVVGYSLDEIVGQHHRMFVTPEYEQSEDYQTFWRELGEGKKLSGEFSRLNKFQEPVWIQASYNPVYDSDGSLIRVIKFAVDITAQKKMAAQAASTISAIDRSQGVIEYETDGTVCTANDNFLEMMGYDLGEIIGEEHSMFLFDEDAALPSYQALWDDLARGQSHTSEVRRKSGSDQELFLQATYSPIMNAVGEPAGVVEIASDITPIVQARQKREGTLKGIFERLTELSKASTLASEKSEMIATVSDDTSNTVEAVATSAEQFSSSVEEIRNQIMSVVSIAEDAMQKATNSSALMDKLAVDAGKVGHIVGLINKIADQTNLLALNATIEAARAGDAGRGFAVVASEVKSLATQTAKATDEISDQINAIQSSTGEAVEVMKGVATTISQINEATGGISAAVDEQGAVTEEVSRNMDLASAGVSELTSSVRGIFYAIKTIDEMTERVRDLSQTLVD